MADNKRVALSNKIRFEVFRRDSFKCQYCGKGAPDIVLNVDHINPLSKGGTNEIFNLITSCFECNQGKKARKLDDENEVSKQKKQLDLLNERRVQLDMLLQWKTGIIKNSNDQSAKIGKYLIKKLGATDHILSDTGKLKIKNFLKKLSPSKLVEFIDETIDQLSNSISYFGITDKTFEIIFTILNAKYRAETSSTKEKINFIMKTVNYHYRLNEDSLTMIKKSLFDYFEIYDSANDYTSLIKSIKEVTAQEFYDSINI